MGAEAPHSHLRTALAGSLGVILLLVLLAHTGLDQLHDEFEKLGWLSPLVLLPFLVVSVLDTIAWRKTLPVAVRRLVPFQVLLFSRVAGEAVNSVTPAASLGGEPVKAHLLRAYGVALSDGLASIVVARTTLTIAQSLFTALGIVGLFLVLGRLGLAVVWLVVLLAVLVGFTYLLLHVQQRNPATALWRGLSRLMPNGRFVRRLEAGANAIDGRLQDFYRGERRAFVTATAWNFAAWVFGVVEVQLILTLIGHPIPWLEAFVIEAVAQPIRAVAIVIPAGLGAQEWGGVAFCRFLGMPESVAATLWLAKRGREIVFDLLGLLYLARRTTAGAFHA
ncbi:MAG: flippase-like domain-containing protein [Candidatus Binatia bacterium]